MSNENVVIEAVKDSKLKLSKYRNEFLSVFETPLSKFYGSGLSGLVIGFDVVAFDEYLCVPDGQSCKDFVQEKYGDAGSKLVSCLMK
ncbi:MAG: hypothetical protein DRO11_09925 [Methanobacteriota archaeon]|nr:MAG: hypothetical protein DRO11_09925 [Euryarchaeota archaeon]